MAEVFTCLILTMIQFPARLQEHKARFPAQLLKTGVFFMTLFTMNFKVISRSLLFKIYIFFLSFVYLLLMWLIEWQEGPQSSTLYLILDRLAPFEMALFVFSFCMAVYIAQQKYTLEKTCFLPRNQIIHNKLAAVIACSCAICLLPTMSILLHAGIDQIGARFTLLAVLAIIPRWIVLIAFAETLGFICGSFISSFYIYLLVIPFSIIFSYLNTALTGKASAA